jgi:hypothetical protein
MVTRNPAGPAGPVRVAFRRLRARFRRPLTLDKRLAELERRDSQYHKRFRGGTS